MSMNINENITKYREKAGLTKSQLARELNVSAAYITMLENGKKTPSKDLIIRMSHIFKITPDKLDNRLQPTDYDKIAVEFDDLIASSNSEEETKLLLLVKDRLFKHYYERGTYKTNLFTFYEYLGEIFDTPTHYDEIEEKIFSVGLDNFKKILPENYLLTLNSTIGFMCSLKKLINVGYLENDPECISFLTSTLCLRINEFDFLDIPKEKKINVAIELVDSKQNIPKSTSLNNNLNNKDK